MVAIFNAAGELLTEEGSDAAACRWFLDMGCRGDTIDTGESLDELCRSILDIVPRYDRSTGEVINRFDPDHIRLRRHRSSR